MLKKLLLIFSALCIYNAAYANPFLTCDPHPNTTSYTIVFDNGEEEELPAPLMYDLAGIEEGVHVAQVRAKNVWGVSSIVPFEFTKALPLLPTNTRLTNVSREALR